jgi:ribonuclease-3
MIDFSKFEKKIGIKFKNKNLLKQAFTHRSYINENPPPAGGLLGHNERLEFLGDAVLELVITEHLFSKYPKKNEGELTSFRAALVNADMLSRVAKSLSMGDFLLLSRGEKKDVGRARQYILANTFEALVGAIYLDRGYGKVFSFLKNSLFPMIKEVIEKKLWIDAKSLFQEKAQEFKNITPSYRVVGEAGPDHAKNFIIGVYLNGEMIAEGKGVSKQEAEQSAARHALKLKKWED